MAVFVDAKTQKCVLSQLAFCVGNGKMPREVRSAKCMVEELFDSRTPSFKFSISAVNDLLDDAKEQLPNAKHSEWEAMSSSIIAILTATGYRWDVKTPFEHALIGSSSGEEYLSTTPFRPISVIESKFTIKEAKVARRLDTVFYPLGILYNMNSASVPASLEPLNENGDAVRLPRIVDMAKLKRALKNKTIEDAINIAATGQKLLIKTLGGDLPKEIAAVLLPILKKMS